MSRLCVVTASIAPERTREFWGTWLPLTTLPETRVVRVINSPDGIAAAPLAYLGIWDLFFPEVLGPVAAFSKGIEFAMAQYQAPLIACLHDDVALYERGWDQRIVEHFDRHGACTLAGWSGCEGLGSPEIYQAPKELHQLARQGFFSNMVGGEAHGRIDLAPRKSACADGFSQIGRAAFLKRAFAYIAGKGVVHHAFDSWLGMLAWRWGGECWYLPERVHHAGGRTAVLAEEWHAFAKKHGGDQGIWRQAHEALWEDGRGFLPYRVDP
jgi:hypothetical protein